MAEYKYEARNKTGQAVTGTLRAPNESRAKALLTTNNLQVVSLALAAKPNWLNRDVWGGRVNTKDLIMFSRQLSTMISAGVPILEAINAQIKQSEKIKFTSLLQEISYDIEGGASLSNVLAKHTDVFDAFYVGVVRTGEASGRLAQSLETLAGYIEKNYVFMRKVRSAMLYPAFVLVGVLIVVLLMFTYIVPQIVGLFQEAQVQLPLPTRILLWVNNAITGYWYVAIIALVAAGVLFRSYLRTPEGRYTLSSSLLRLPGLRAVFSKIYLARLTAVLQTLFQSNVPIVESLMIVRSSIGNAVYEKILDRTITAVKDGMPISQVWEHEEHIPALVVTMVAVGEKSGELQRAFGEANRFFSRDVDELLTTISVLLEPLLVIILAVAVGIVVAGVLLPIYNLVSVL